MKQVYVLVAAVVLVSLLGGGFWLLSKDEDKEEASSTVPAVSEERKMECDNFMMVALFPNDGSAEIFLEDCYQGLPVLPSDTPNELPPPVSDENTSGPYIGEGCAVGGCSQQLCGEAGEIEDMVSTCEWREEYACYAAARCEKQVTGSCGWSETNELEQCRQNAANLSEEPVSY